MNSSGIKRGLATTAVSALAVAGIPFIATSASAVPGDSIVLASAGPVRNAGTVGGQFVFKTKGVAAADLEVASPDFTQGPNTPNQTVAIVGVPTLVANGAPGDSDPNDGLDEITAFISVTGANYNFGVYEDEANPGVVDAGEARTTVTGSTTGAPTSITVSPTLQSAPVNTNSGEYTVTIRDAANNVTQLSGAEVINIAKATGLGTMAFTDAQLDTADLADGTSPFRAQADIADLYTIGLTGVGGAVAGRTGSASLDVSGDVAQNIAVGDVDVVTGADTFNGFGNPGDATPNTYSLRPDQSSVTINVRNQTPGEVVILNVAGGGVTFGGATSTQVRATVAANGTASLTFAVDAASIQNNDTITVSGSLAANLVGTFAAPAVSVVDADATTYISSFGGTVSPVVSVTDQYGNPVSGVFVTYDLNGGANAGAESARVQVGSDGKVTFNITDTKATAANNATDSIVFRVYAGQFDAAPLVVDNGSQIRYTANGQGADFLLTVDGQTPGGAAYNPVIKPLTDTTADDAGDSTDEDATLAIVGGTPNASVTVTADNGGLVLKNGQTRLSQAAASQTGEVGVDTFEIVGTEAGTVNVTVTSGGKTQTGTVTVQPLAQGTLLEQAASPATARNIAVSGPESVVAGDVVEFTAVITDAFGNPVRNFAAGNVNTLLTGPAVLQGNSGPSNADGEIVYTVELNQDARNPITFRVTGTTQDFGAAADRLTAASTTNDGTGLTASVNVASASAEVVNLDELEQAVADAEQALADAEAALASATADLDVAQTELAVAQANVDALKERRADLRQKLNKAKRNDNMQKAKTTRKKLRAVKRDLRAANDAVTIATAKVAAEQVSVDSAQDAVDQAEENLAEAQADLDEAQN